MVLEWFNNIVMPIVYAGLAATATAVVKEVINKLGDVTREYICDKIKTNKAILKNENLKFLMQNGLNVWNEVDEHFRITENIEKTSEEKIKMFNDLLISRVPGVTESQVKEIRQAIAGEINRSKDKIEKELNNINISEV